MARQSLNIGDLVRVTREATVEDYTPRWEDFIQFHDELFLANGIYEVADLLDFDGHIELLIGGDEYRFVVPDALELVFSL